MAYNNFPVTYQPNYYPQMQQPMMQPTPPVQIPQPQMSNAPQQPQPQNIIWIQGLSGAKSYMVAPGTTVPLWDSESKTIYLKSADASGMPSIKILDYTIRNTDSITTPMMENDGYSMLNNEMNNMTHSNMSSANTDIIDSTGRTIDIDDYATKDDIASIRNQLNDMKDVLSNMAHTDKSHSAGGNNGGGFNNNNSSNVNNNSGRNK